MADQVYKVRDPQGNIREIKGPAGATDDEVIAQAQKLFAAPPSGIPGPRQQRGFLETIGAPIQAAAEGIITTWFCAECAVVLTMRTLLSPSVTSSSEISDSATKSIRVLSFLRSMGFIDWVNRSRPRAHRAKPNASNND